MDLRQLRSFLAVIDHGSFSAAAESLFTVQSNVSTHVAKLETQLGVSLLDRRTRDLTPAGETVERRGREILRQLTAISDELASLEDRVIGNVACGTTPSVGLWVIPPTIATATKTLPEVSVTVVEAQSDALAQQLMTTELDLAITTGAVNPDLMSEPLFDEDIVAVVGRDHPLHSSSELTLKELAETKLLLPLSDNPLHTHIAKEFERAGFPLKVGLQVGSSALVSALAAAGVGVALVPASFSPNLATQSAGRKPITDMAPRGVALAMRRGLQPSQAALAIRSIVAQTARQTAASMPGCHVRTATAPDDDKDLVSIAP